MNADLFLAVEQWGSPDIATESGAPVYFAHPERTEVILDDLRVASGRLCRYGGHFDVTLLAHTALVVRLAEWIAPGDTELAAYAAAHDLHEVYVGDLPPALKRELPDFKARIETPWEAHVHRRLGLSWPRPDGTPQRVKQLDKLALALEMAETGHPFSMLLYLRHMAPTDPEYMPVSPFDFSDLRRLAAGVLASSRGALWVRVVRALRFQSVPEEAPRG